MFLKQGFVAVAQLGSIRSVSLYGDKKRRVSCLCRSVALNSWWNIRQNAESKSVVIASHYAFILGGGQSQEGIAATSLKGYGM